MSAPITLQIEESEALVLFELLSRFDNSGVVSILDSSESVALTNLLCCFEKLLSAPFDSAYAELLSAARAELRPEAGTNSDAELAEGRLALWLDPEHIELLGNEWRGLAGSAPDETRKKWAEVGFRAVSALHKAGIEFRPSFPEEHDQ